MNQQNPFWGAQPSRPPMPAPIWGSPTGATQPAPRTGDNPFMPGQKNTQSNFIPGRVVNDASDIMPVEVPMDGQPAFFPKADYSCIYGRVWSQDGRIVPVTFVPYVEPTEESKDDGSAEENQNGGMQEILSRLGDIENLLNNFMAATTPKEDISEKSPKPKTSDKKESVKK